MIGLVTILLESFTVRMIHGRTHTACEERE